MPVMLTLLLAVVVMAPPPHRAKVLTTQERTALANRVSGVNVDALGGFRLEWADATTAPLELSKMPTYGFVRRLRALLPWHPRAPWEVAPDGSFQSCDARSGVRRCVEWWKSGAVMVALGKVDLPWYFNRDGMLTPDSAAANAAIATQVGTLVKEVRRTYRWRFLGYGTGCENASPQRVCDGTALMPMYLPVGSPLEKVAMVRVTRAMVEASATGMVRCGNRFLEPHSAFDLNFVQPQHDPLVPPPDAGIEIEEQTVTYEGALPTIDVDTGRDVRAAGLGDWYSALDDVDRLVSLCLLDE